MKKQNKSIKAFNLPFTKDVEAVFGSSIVNKFRRHIHKKYIIGIVTDGSRLIQHSGGTSRISENEIFIINPGEVHSCSSEAPGHSYMILCVSVEIMRSVSSQISGSQGKELYFKDIRYRDDELSRKITDLFASISDPDSGIRLESLFYSFLSCLLIRYWKNPCGICVTGEEKDSVKRVCEYINDNYQENLSLSELADIACQSQYHFQREFKRIIGITPHEYLSDFKINKSKKWLAASENIADIAARLGFYDQSHFSKMFRRTVGISPGQYAKINRVC